MVNLNSIAIIPARGGSKRIANKNIRIFSGKPMIAWTIEAAIASKKFDRVFVSTDSQEIADIARAYGLEVPFLRDKYADDVSTASQATAYTVEKIQEQLNETYDCVAQLMPNCPLRSSLSIQLAIDHFISKNLNFQISCCKFGWSNPWWAFSMDESGHVNQLFPEAVKKRSQDLPVLYCPTGAIWVAKSKELLTSKSFYGPGHTCLPMSWMEAIDIDTIEDWDIAENISQKMINMDLDMLSEKIT